MPTAQIELIARFSEEDKEKAEAQILGKQKETDYEIREYPVEVVVKKFTEGLQDDTAEIFIPDYQRELVWKERQQAKFIESMLMNLPIPYIFVADNNEGDNAGRLEIVDGSQRVRTLVRYVTDQLTLDGLEVLPALNGFKFSDLPIPRQKRFLRKTLRLIEMTFLADEEARHQLFDRLNSGGTKLEEMEQRIGARRGEFTNFIRELAQDAQFRRLCPVGPARVIRREYEELVLRFFAYYECYEHFDKQVNEFLNDYLTVRNEEFNETELREKFRNVLNFVEIHFPNHFRKSPNNQSVPRIRFEAIAVGVALALDIEPQLTPPPVSGWINSEAFIDHTRSDASNSKPKVINRIHFVRDNLLGRAPEYVGSES